MDDAVTPNENEAAEHVRQQHADRQWRYRRRRKRGLKPFTVDLFPHELDSLVEHGVLAEADRTDQAAVSRALGRLLSVAIGQLRRGELRL